MPPVELLPTRAGCCCPACCRQLEQEPSSVNLIVTGFSAFAGVPDNPSERLVRWIQQADALAGLPRCGGLQASVLEVSAAAVDAWMAQLRPRLRELRQPAVLVHLGVDGKRRQYSLERRAANEAHFRVPDQAGYQPQHARIDGGQGAAGALLSPLPLQRLGEALRAKGHEARVSDDAGRFVCNWTLYRSLQLAQEGPQGLGQQEGGGGGGGQLWGSMFLHVPSFEVFPEEQQRAFVVDFLHELYALLCGGGGGGGGGDEGGAEQQEEEGRQAGGGGGGAGACH
jgi:pyroglutamyl-peptidase